ncbi:nucleoside phosphatase GDA1/CD39 [Pavlovales sp. CCMP2436]|nr:nucleoside phosphatase GDA1/CD39 [Pavlovales sp. CCMP2436]|mmetsp:Transcript_4788/g.12607  ORF Transcript_4788/g.12607 Transcript_4788/m.12607 type:complete len:459 (-) Transcript_4788:551-1927(-)
MVRRREAAFAALAGVLALGVGRAEPHHGVVFDAGSSGTRIHVYTWESGGAHGSFDLISDDLLKIKPGLSAYKDTTSTAGESLQPLLEYAYEHIPETKRKSAAAYLMATAGLRLVGEAKKDAILKSVCDKLGSSAFIFQCGWATLLSGYDEGLYGWVTVNYLMKVMNSAKQTTYGTIDLGGGSVQIVFEPSAQTPLPAPYLANVPMADGSKQVYVKSHLGYGLDEARRSIASVVAKEGKMLHPCMPIGWTGSVTTTGGGEVEMKGVGKYAACVQLIESIFPKAECPLAPCSIQGSFQPKLVGEFIGFSYMYDRTKQIGLIDDDPQVYGEQKMDLAAIKSGAARMCALKSDAMHAKFAKHPELDKSQNFCGDAVFISALIEHGFGFAPETLFTMTNKINSIEIVWTLGAMIAKYNESHAGGSSAIWAVAILGALVLAIVLCFRKSLFGGYGLLPFRYNTL